MKFNLKTAGIILIAAVFFIFDRTFKWLFINVWSRADWVLADGWLRLKLSLNRGIAFSLPLPSLLIIGAIILITVGLVVWAFSAWQNQKLLVFFALALIIVGACSNLLDRFKYGAVIDYLEFRFFYSVINLADLMIIAGLILLIFSNSGKILRPKH